MTELQEAYINLIRAVNDYQIFLRNSIGSTNPLISNLISQVNNDFQLFGNNIVTDMNQIITRQSINTVNEHILRHQLEVINANNLENLSNCLAQRATSLREAYHQFVYHLLYEISEQGKIVVANSLMSSFLSSNNGNSQSYARDVLNLRAEFNEASTQAAIEAIQLVQIQRADDQQFYGDISSMPAFYDALSRTQPNRIFTDDLENVKNSAELTAQLDSIYVNELIEGTSCEQINQKLSKLFNTKCSTPAVGAPAPCFQNEQRKPDDILEEVANQFSSGFNLPNATSQANNHNSSPVAVPGSLLSDELEAILEETANEMFSNVSSEEAGSTNDMAAQNTSINVINAQNVTSLAEILGTLPDLSLVHK